MGTRDGRLYLPLLECESEILQLRALLDCQVEGGSPFLLEHNDLSPPAHGVVPITCNIDVAKRLSPNAKPQTSFQDISIANFLCLFDMLGLLFLVVHDLRYLLLVDLAEFDFTLVNLVDEHFLLQQKLFRLQIDLLALLPDLVEFVHLEDPLLFVLFVRSAHRAQNLLVHGSKLSCHLIPLEVVEHLVKFFLRDQPH